MKKILFFLSVIICGNLFAQVNQTFSPQSGKSYFIKVQDRNNQLYSYYLYDNGGNLGFEMFSAAEADGKSEAQWLVEYVANQGYTLKNKATNHYFTAANSTAGVANGISTSSSSVANANYFELRTVPDLFSISGLTYSFTKQGYSIIIPNTGYALDAYNASGLGTWGWNNGNSQNQDWLFLGSEELTNFENAIADKAKVNPFTPVAGAAYYIKNRLMSTNALNGGQDQTYLIDDNGTLSLALIDDSDIKAATEAQWSITLDATNGGYLIQNTATNNLLKFVGNNMSPGGFQVDVAGSYVTMDLADERSNPFTFTYTNPTTNATFTAPSFRVMYVNQGAVQGLDNANGIIGSWGANLGTNQKWMFFSESDLDRYIEVTTGKTSGLNPISDKKGSFVLYPLTAGAVKVVGESIKEIRIFDLSGRNVSSYSYAGQNEAVIETGKLSAGVYVAKVVSTEGISASLKFIKK